MRRLAEVLIAALVLTAAAVFVTWPLAAHPSNQLSGHMDSFFSTWRLAWIAEAVRTPGLALFDAPIFHPEPRTFAYSDAILLTGLAVAPLRYLGLAPVLTYNLTLLAAIVTGGLGVFALVRYLAGRADAATVAAVIFALSPHRVEHIDHLEMQVAVFMPLALLAWHRAVEGGRPPLAGVAVILVAAQWLSCIYYGLLFAPVLLAVMATEWWFVDPAARRPVAKAVAAGALIAALIIAVYSWPYLQNRAQTGDRQEEDVVRYSATPGDYLTVHPRNALYGDVLPSSSWTERFLFPGVLPVGLALAGLVSSRAGRRRWVYVAAAVVAFDLSLGVNGVIFPILRSFVMPYGGLRAPARAAVLVVLATAVFAGWGAATVLQRVRHRALRWVLTMGLLIALVIEFRTPGEVRYAPAPQPGIDIDRQTVLLELPLPPPNRADLNADAYFMVRRIGVWPRLLNGSSGYYPMSYRMMLERLAQFPDDRSVAEIRRLGTTRLAIHERWLPAERYEQWLAALDARAGMQYLGSERDGDKRVAVFAVSPVP